MAKHSRCRGKRKRDGKRCEVELNLDGDGYCVWHRADQTEADAIHKAGGRGMKNRARKVRGIPSPLRTLADCSIWASWVAMEIARKKISPREGREIVGAVRQFLAAVEKEQLQTKISELQKQLREAKRR